MVEATIELMAEKGFAKFRFEELAVRVGYNRATIYRYFDSKQDLITEVMVTLQREISNGIIQETSNTQNVTRKTFTDVLYKIINDLRTKPRYAIIMDARNVERFADLTHEYFEELTTSMLEKFMMDNPDGRVLKEGVTIADAVHWVMHQITSYAFFGLKGETEEEQKDYLEKMVVSVII